MLQKHPSPTASPYCVAFFDASDSTEKAVGAKEEQGVAVKVVVGQEEMGTYTKVDGSGGAGKQIPWRCAELH
jgi:hypothetical protein